MKTIKDIALEKLQRYCAYQDRCHSEVRTKLLSLEIYGEELEEIISELIQENFLDEQRFAMSYARGKFKMKGWGRIKIKNELIRKNVSPYCIKKGLAEIEEEDYLQKLDHIIEKKKKTYTTPLNQKDKQKLIRFLLSKGYEINYILESLN